MHSIFPVLALAATALALPVATNDVTALQKRQGCVDLLLGGQDCSHHDGDDDKRSVPFDTFHNTAVDETMEGIDGAGDALVAVTGGVIESIVKRQGCVDLLIGGQDCSRHSEPDNDDDSDSKGKRSVPFDELHNTALDETMEALDGTSDGLVGVTGNAIEDVARRGFVPDAFDAEHSDYSPYADNAVDEATNVVGYGVDTTLGEGVAALEDVFKRSEGPAYYNPYAYSPNGETPDVLVYGVDSPLEESASASGDVFRRAEPSVTDYSPFADNAVDEATDNVAYGVGTTLDESFGALELIGKVKRQGCVDLLLGGQDCSGSDDSSKLHAGDGKAGVGRRDNGDGGAVDLTADMTGFAVDQTIDEGIVQPVDTTVEVLEGVLRRDGGDHDEFNDSDAVFDGTMDGADGVVDGTADVVEEPVDDVVDAVKTIFKKW